jgi:crotonobetainyl-CoA:carnitine CoA-transferase CaiB-like acyl-CoA transferase
MKRQDLLDDPKLRTEPDRFTARPTLNVELGETLRSRTSAEWLDIFEQAGVPAGPIYTMDEVFADPQVEHLKMSASVEHPVRGQIDVVATPVHLSRTPAAVVSAAPDPGDHNNEILSGLGFDAEAIARFKADGVI